MEHPPTICTSTIGPGVRRGDGVLDYEQHPSLERRAILHTPPWVRRGSPIVRAFHPTANRQPPTPNPNVKPQPPTSNPNPAPLPSSRRTPGPTDTEPPPTIRTSAMGPGVRRGEGCSIRALPFARATRDIVPAALGPVCFAYRLRLLPQPNSQPRTPNPKPPSVIPADAGTHGYGAPANDPHLDHGRRRPPG